MSERLNLRKLPGLWLIIDNKVYDVTSFKSHPGGYDILEKCRGQDASSEFKKANHPDFVQSDMQEYYLGEVPNITQAELSLHKSEDSTWMALFNKVYDVTHFSTHPGGHEILVDHSGKDSTKAFEDIDHSVTAKSDLNNFFIGNYIPGPESDNPKSSSSSLYIIIALVLAVLSIAIRSYLSN